MWLYPPMRVGAPRALVGARRSTVLQQLGRGQPLRMREHLVTVGAIDSPHVADWDADVQVSDAARRCAQAKACSKGLLRQCVVSKDGCGYSCPCAIRRNGTEPEMVRPLDVIGRCVSQLAHGQPEAWHGLQQSARRMQREKIQPVSNACSSHALATAP